MPAGRPPKYKTAEQLQAKIDEYFKEKVKNEPLLDQEGNPMRDRQGRLVYDIKPPTVAGLALYLGFCDRKSLYEYKEKPEFTHTIKACVTKIEEYAEIQLTQGNSTGAIFWLKNHRWKDKTTTEHEGDAIAPTIIINEQLKENK